MSLADELFDEPRPLAGRGLRLIASFIDSMAGTVSFLPLVAAVSWVDVPDGPWMIAAILWTLFTALGLITFQVYFLSTRGQSLGKWLMKVQIVRNLDESNPGFLRAVLLRGLLPAAGAIPLFGFLISLGDVLFIFGRERRCLHDYLADTKVVEYADTEG